MEAIPAFGRYGEAPAREGLANVQPQLPSLRLGLSGVWGKDRQAGIILLSWSQSTVDFVLLEAMEGMRCNAPDMCLATLVFFRCGDSLNVLEIWGLIIRGVPVAIDLLSQKY